MKALIANVTASPRFPEYLGFSSVRIWNVKMKAAARVAASPLPMLSSPGLIPERTAHPASTSRVAMMIFPPGKLRILRHATSGRNTQ